MHLICRHPDCTKKCEWCSEKKNMRGDKSKNVLVVKTECTTNIFF